ncbi:Gfo/Idh/MocA family oxidoreductase [Leptolyngbya boryana CZ1]|uniref:Gfo/Idh/MocA family oxidoreductase n=1 Tax=Leptolyngbya boryana CZ1 TaxID=3060204 RepID=A0AA96WWV8_LEPBY|nr:Gfo/Idh/MocA family oxidoreductase [Leptolyngbya boryana]WNZ46738.1 Gfo/Idh/MocA family oxidoreductase [Leptolyngbya boryana CZ1]
MIRVGIVGTGYAAKLRAEAINQDDRAKLVGVAGHRADKTTEFGHTHQTQAFNAWQELLGAVDLVIICGVNSEHSAIAQTALESGKHVVVEYPLAIDLESATTAIETARAQNRLLHVEHIELLGGVHQAFLRSLSQIGTPFYARYATATPQHPAPAKWTYNPSVFGFPLVGALSRLHRLVHVFGQVESVSCQNRYLNLQSDRFLGCMCKAQLNFQNGVIADVVYSKGETAWSAERKLEVQGDQGALVFEGDSGVLINAEGATPIEIGARRGLFTKDTSAVLDYLLDGKPLYVQPEESLYTLKVAIAAQRSAESGQTIRID